ncbi:DUF2798 domain-containing protein [Methylophilus medardicus]|uniref:DUF2798 domain-containing protein n=1 Tax=Methylophilus medardicus TaxID=2588534 RepID=A0A5B8CRC5_9PROT|nr:DUF2798 domain-containing protein [Methylophilus medardicus]QDC43821.1 DUF2798 domain-containing protein [Methylophilus medardicus]QDC48828.1 DUF2798 domain-containing protein [Methylophilus medardicus]QDC52533.1 DUF2798 domain-containing protein [Methylophilus medardicus]
MNIRYYQVRKLPKQFTPYVFAFLMAGIMAFLMSMVIVAANTGVHSGYLWRVLHAYTLAMPIAFICVLMVRPIVMFLVSLLVDGH